MNIGEYASKSQSNFCTKCGNKLVGNAAYCSTCGAPVKTIIAQRENNVVDCIKTLSLKEQISGIVWIVVAFFQIIIGYIGSFAFLVLGISNIFTGIARLKQSQKVLTPYDGMIKEYENRWKAFIVSLIFNLLIGGVVGFMCSVATICEINARNYALKNKDLLRPNILHKTQ